MRLRWIFALTVLMLALALAACGGGGDEKEDENGGERETPAATETVETEETQKPAETEEPEETAKPEKTEEPSGGGGASLGDVPVYPGAEKVADYSGDDAPLPLLVGDLDLEEYETSAWAVYETDDSVEDVADWYKDKMTGAGWEEESWFDFTFGGGVASGTYTQNDGDDAAWVVVAGDEDRVEIFLGTGSR